jgi:hypothetical protein
MSEHDSDQTEREPNYRMMSTFVVPIPEEEEHPYETTNERQQPVCNIGVSVSMAAADFIVVRRRDAFAHDAECKLL